jgi:hypothetical protein
MTDTIGTAAGKIWNVLKKNGPMPVAKIQKGIDEPLALTNQAIGWLAREGKISVDRTKSNPIYTLRD